MYDEVTRAWIRINCAFGAGNIKTWQVFDMKDPMPGVEYLLSNPALQSDPHVNVFRRLTSANIDSVINSCVKNGIEIITPNSSRYPESLRNIPDPPAALYVLGDIGRVKDVPALAVVGARDCCDHSKWTAENFCYVLAKFGIGIISGFARGIDSAAHNAALAMEGGVTAAVLGCGIMYDYPRNSWDLKRRIAERGAVISEYMPHAEPHAGHFKVRNRLITGLSDAVFIVEAGNRSGALNSAFHAVEQGREVFVLPPFDVFDTRFDGQRKLLYEGASFALAPIDIYEFFHDKYAQM